jgi:hydroxymethylglutaryl-CoA reductase (NADPH)
VPGGLQTAAALARRQAFLRERGCPALALAAAQGQLEVAALAGNIEHLAGFITVPLGVIGPLRLNGSFAHGDYYVPLATTEGAMVASYQRGAWAISQAGGATVVCLEDSLTRAPCFRFATLSEACAFAAWCVGRLPEWRAVAAATTRHGVLDDLALTLNSKTVHLTLRFSTGEAAGQNMVTIAADAVCRHLLAQSPVQPQDWYVEGNLSGDKKVTAQSFMSNRGKKAVAEVRLPAAVVRRYLGTSPLAMCRYCRESALAGVQSGAVGVQGHYANALAGLFLACGQDVACVAEAAVGMTDMEVTPAGDLYAAVSLPNLVVGTVGGGTHLPTARECLQLLGCQGPGSARKLAEIAAGTVLAGELSIIAAMCAGDFASAHATHRHRG